MRTKIFAYKGVIGIKSALTADGIVNNPEENGLVFNERGHVMLDENKQKIRIPVFLVRASCVDISPEALDLLKKIKKGKEPIGEVMSYKAGEVDIFGWTGGPLKILSSKVLGDVNYNPSILKSTNGVIIEKSLIAYVDKLDTEGELSKYKI